MSDRLDYEKENKINRALKRGQDFVDGTKLTDQQRNRLREGIEKTNKKAAVAVDNIRAKEAELMPRNPRQQIAHLDHLFRELSPTHKRSKQYGLFLKQKIAELKGALVSQERETTAFPKQGKRAKKR